MPDPVLILKSSVAAAVLAAVALLLAGWPWRWPRARRVAAGGALAVGAALYLGVWVLGVTPQFPPREDQDRLLLVLLPAAIGVELTAALLPRRPWLAWSFRLAVAAAAPRILLHDSVYLVESGGMWSPQQQWLILGTLGVTVLLAWGLLDRLAGQTASPVVPLALAVTTAGAGVTVMLSGYASGGELGFPLAAGLAGTAMASLVLSGPRDLTGSIGVGLVGLFALLVVGRFFGSLTDLNAAVLFVAPQLGWLPAMPVVRRMRPVLSGIAGMAAVAVPVALVVGLAAQRFAIESASPSATPETRQPSVNDYMNFGK
jgi:hypothetical protein